MNKNSFTLTTLSENPEYFEAVITLIEKEFHYKDPFSYAKDFALLMDPLNFDNCYLYVDQETNNVVSHLGVCTRTMVKNNHTLNIAFIGGIATCAQHRGRGLFKSLMNHALHIHSRDCGLFILWSEITGLYEKFSFHLSGGLIETGHTIFTDNDRPLAFTKTSFKDLSNKDFENIQNIYKEFNQKYFFTVIRQEKDWSIIRGMNSIDLYTKKNEAGLIEQYFCVNKGHDLTNVIHEIGCIPNQYSQMMKSLQKYKIWLPEGELALSIKKDIFFTAFMKLGNFELLKDFLLCISHRELELFEMTGDLIKFRYITHDYQSSHKDFMQYLFGPRPLREFESLRLSPYIPGTDSI